MFKDKKAHKRIDVVWAAHFDLEKRIKKLERFLKLEYKEEPDNIYSYPRYVRSNEKKKDSKRG